MYHSPLYGVPHYPFGWEMQHPIWSKSKHLSSWPLACCYARRCCSQPCRGLWSLFRRQSCGGKELNFHKLDQHTKGESLISYIRRKNIQWFTETKARSNYSYTPFGIPKNGRVRSTRQNNSKLQYVSTLCGRKRMTQSRQKFAVLSTRSPCLIGRHSFYQYVGQKTVGEKGNITDSQFDYTTKNFFIKYQQQL